MLVKNWMSTNAITINTEESLQQAITVMKENNLRHLPVTGKGKLVGMISDQDLKRISTAEATSLELPELIHLLSRTRITSIMSKTPVSIFSDSTLEEAAQLMLKHNIRCLPVTNKENEIIGVITQTDIFRIQTSMIGSGEKGVQLALQIKDFPGSLKEILDTIHSCGGRLASILTSNTRAPQGFNNVYIRLHHLGRNHLDKLLDNIKAEAHLLYMVDISDGRREIWD